MLGKDLYNQTIVISVSRPLGRSNDNTFHARFPNIFVDYPLGSMREGDKLWTNCAPLRLWQRQFNFAMWCASSACGVSSEHLNYTNHPMVKSLYRFHVYYHIRRILKRLQVPLPREAGFSPYNLYTNEDFSKFVRIIMFLMIP